MNASVSRKVLGEQAECAFVAVAMRRGLIVSKPYGDSAPYDFIVQRRQTSDLRRQHKTRADRRGRRGKQRPQARLWRVQVKSTSTFNRWYNYQISSSHCGGPYRPDEIDFLAAWVPPLDVWYIIPIQEIKAASTASLFPHVPHSRGKYERYREAWEQLSG